MIKNPIWYAVGILIGIVGGTLLTGSYLQRTIITTDELIQNISIGFLLLIMSVIIVSLSISKGSR